MGIIRFSTDGWRARVGEGLDERHVVRLVDAIALMWARHRDNATVFIGYDTRRDSKRYACRAAETMSAAGFRAIVSDRPCPAPALGYAARSDKDSIGALMITASEAPCEQGGLIAFSRDGGPTSTAFADSVEQAIKGDPSQARGPYAQADIVTPYKDAVVALARTPQEASRLRIVVDAMYGTAVDCAGEVFRRCGYEVIDLHNRAVPDFRGLHPSVSEPWVDQCERKVVEERADFGIVIGGDGRHAAVIDGQGYLVSRHDLAPLVMRSCADQGAQGRVISTFATSERVERQAELLGFEHTKVPVGFEAIYREFHENDVMMAADALGGISLPTHVCERDGLVAATLACNQFVTRGGVEATLAAQRYELGPHEWGDRIVRLDLSSVQRLRNMLPGINPEELAGMEPETVSHGDGLRVGLPDGSWLLVRLARFRPEARVVAEAASAAKLTELLQAGSELVRVYATP